MSADSGIRTASAPSPALLRAIFDAKYGAADDLGWGPRQRLRFGYYTPDDHYEALLASLVFEGCRWADIGCGRDIFPSNPGLARRLTGSAALVVGIDPDANVHDNVLLDERFCGPVEDYESARRFDLITLRMVAEHIAQPRRVVAKLGELAAPGCLAVIYTPAKYAPASILAALTPMRTHHLAKKLLWQAHERDTFPVRYKMNTRSALTRLFRQHGFEETLFCHLDDCRASNRFRRLNLLELSSWRLLRRLGLRYPECCLLGVYRRLGTETRQPM